MQVVSQILLLSVTKLFSQRVGPRHDDIIPAFGRMQVMSRNIIIQCCSGTAALKDIFDPKPRAGQLHATRFRRYVEELLGRDPANTIDIDWSPGHEDIKGNERADELAKAAAQMWCANETTTITHAKRATRRGHRPSGKMEEDVPYGQVRGRGPYSASMEAEGSLHGHQEGGLRETGPMQNWARIYW